MRVIRLAIALVGGIGLCSLGSHAQTPAPQTAPALKYNLPDQPKAETLSAQLTQERLRAHLQVLASDSFMGRETGEAGQKMAAAYISNYLLRWGLAPPFRTKSDSGYLQSFKVYRSRISSVIAGLKGTPFVASRDFIPMPHSGADVILSKAPLLFIGYGLGNGPGYYPTAKAANLKGKVLVMLDGQPRLEKPDPQVEQLPSQAARRLNVKSKNLQDVGAEGIIMVTPFTPATQSYLRTYYANLRAGYMRLVAPVQTAATPKLIVSYYMGAALLGLDSATLSRFGQSYPADSIARKKFESQLPRPKPKPLYLGLKTEVDTLLTENVAGLVRGSERPDEVVVLSAHYDHLGVREGKVFNGADDDGSGTVSLLEMARITQQAAENGDRPRRSMMFLWFTGEEKGLLGSEYYSNHPAIPMEKTSLNLNTDMIGRIDTEHGGKEDYVYIIGSDKISRQLYELVEATNTASAKLSLDYTYNREDHPDQFYYRSDHYNFARKGVPVCFYFTGVHADYHREGDDVEKILFPKMTRIARLIYQTAWNAAQEPNMMRREK